ncbi:hypothetical protein [Cohnella faecalis]|uniref:Uncharacterized protein n=1 Tax=Cohnella faecalis TaxID=2315694 RepID=A0A398CS47_9BACL|nr:hypothetical protein [Cohnella faecalis]RIE05425.1 hypothetical protein D3H35_00625 [Cohnella faecalis]
MAGVALQSGGKKRKGGSGSERLRSIRTRSRRTRRRKAAISAAAGSNGSDPDVNSVSGPRVKRKKGTDMWGLPISGTLSRATDDGEGGIIGEPRKKKGPGGRRRQGNRAGGGRVPPTQERELRNPLLRLRFRRNGSTETQKEKQQ